jgi:ABC-2 type transport system ATP-binding protein/lipopolysaccharide transport system ATP-binding protein
MALPVIQTHGLGKRYRLGAGTGEYETIRGAIESIVRGERGRRRREIWALRDIDLEVGEGEAIGLIGRNGAGKTTLLKILARITEPTVGRSRTRGRVGSLLEVGTGFHPELTGRDNIFLNGAILGMSRREIRSRFDEIVDFADLARFLDTPLKRYSAGMQLRLAFSVAAHLEPDIVLVDEVLAVGDAEFQQKCIGRMSELDREGRTLAFVSHDLGAVRRLCPRAIWIDDGRIAADGPSNEVVDRYLGSHVPVDLSVDIPAADDSAVHLFWAGITDEGGRPVAPRCDKTFSMRTRLRLAEAVPDLELWIYLSNAEGVVVLEERLHDTPVRMPRLNEQRTYEARVDIPPVLAPGEYIMSAWCGSLDEDFFLGEILRFHLAQAPADSQDSAGRRRVLRLPGGLQLRPL